jgi:hypothetical protein
VVPQLPVGEPVRSEAIDDPVGIAELVVEPGPTMSCGRVLRMSPTFLRTWYQMSGTCAGGVESFSRSRPGDLADGYPMPQGFGRASLGGLPAPRPRAGPDLENRQCGWCYLLH